jgi:hypothetical protein
MFELPRFIPMIRVSGERCKGKSQKIRGFLVVSLAEPAQTGQIPVFHSRKAPKRPVSELFRCENVLPNGVLYVDLVSSFRMVDP